MSAAMREVGFRQNPDPVLTSAGDILKTDDPVSTFSALVDQAKGGTLFIDEAYQFKPSKSGQSPSNAVMDYLLKVCEELRETTTFILAGYKDELFDLLQYNEGFQSRFPRDFTFQFEDYNEYQLREIFVNMVETRGFKLEPRRSCGVSLGKVISRRMARGRGKKGYGNARHVSGTGISSTDVGMAIISMTCV